MPLLKGKEWQTDDPFTSHVTDWYDSITGYKRKQNNCEVFVATLHDLGFQ